MVVGIIFLVIVVIFVLSLLLGLTVVRPTHRGVKETLGNYSSFVLPGLNYAFPFFQKIGTIDVTERMADVRPQDIITKDNLNAKVDLVVFYRIKSDENSVKKAFYNVNSVEEQIITLAQTTARNVVGDMSFRDVNSKRNELNRKLADTIDKQTDEWGVKIVRVELKEISPPRDVQDSMNKVIMAENLKDAAKDTATAKETEADGIKRAEIKKAEGLKQSAILEAEGKAKAFDLVNKSFSGNAIKLKQLEVTQASLENNTKVVLTEKGISPQIILGDIPTKSK